MDLTSDQVKTFAAGLYTLAAVDGIDARERAIIDEFLEANGHSDAAGHVEEMGFDPVMAYEVLESSWLRGLFLKSALLLIRADGQVTADERDTLIWMANAFGVPGGYDAIVESVTGESL